jgi:hypothetical protein
MVLSDFNFQKEGEIKTLDNKLVIETCIEMVTINGGPFSVLFDSGFRNPKRKIYFTETKRNEAECYFSRTETK